MDSHEVMRDTITGIGAKSVAADMSLSPSMIYKWCEQKEGGGGGADNPLDRLLKVCQITGDNRPIVWLCEQVNGCFVANPSPGSTEDDIEVLTVTQSILKEFSEMLDVVSQSLSDDGSVDEEESQRIRTAWEELKRTSERFVLACELGRYGKDGSAGG